MKFNFMVIPLITIIMHGNIWRDVLYIMAYPLWKIGLIG